MAFWMELHCDLRREGYLPGTFNERCLTLSNSHPGVLVDSHAAGVRTGQRLLAQEAKARGWKRTRQGWACPGCQQP